MRITVNPILDVETLQWLPCESYDYRGIVIAFKGDSTASATEQSEASFDNTLQSIFSSQYANQQGTLNYLQSYAENVINQGGVGYTSQQLASQRTAATDTTSQQYQNAQQALQNQETAASGGSKLTGVAGANTEAQASLLSQEATAQSSEQEQITQANANLQQQSLTNALNVLSGVASAENPLGYASASSSAAGDVSSLSNAVTASNQSQLLGALGGIVGGVAGAAGNAGSFGALFGCWVAASWWGWDDIRTWVIRMWMLTEAPGWLRTFYLKHGKAIASTPFRWAFRPLFEVVLATA